MSRSFRRRALLSATLFLCSVFLTVGLSFSSQQLAWSQEAVSLEEPYTPNPDNFPSEGQPDFMPITLSEAQDFLQPDKTPTLQAIVACLPPRPSRLLPPQFSLLSSQQVGQDTYHYINVFTNYSGETGRAIEPWQALVKQTGKQCIGLVTQPELVSLTKYVPLSTATTMALARYQYMREALPEQWSSLVQAYKSGVITLSSGPTPDQAPMDSVNGCEYFPEDFEALKQLGVSIAPSCKVRH